jgi:hypothetical protein
VVSFGGGRLRLSRGDRSQPKFPVGGAGYSTRGTGDPRGLQKAPAIRGERRVIRRTIFEFGHGASSWVEFLVHRGVSNRPLTMSTPRSLFDPDRSAERLPVSLITGFLGSGKTTLLNRLLRRPEMADSAVVINEFWR